MAFRAAHGVVLRPAIGIAGTVVLVLAGVFLALWAWDLASYVTTPEIRALLGQDMNVYLDATRRWLDGGPFYLPYQLAGHYEIAMGDVLYPPTAIPLFAAFLVLPTVLWWLVPIAGVAYIAAWHRPSPLGLAGMALCLWFPATNVYLWSGNPVMWSALAIALATRWPAFGAWGGLLKPSLFPFALIGIRSRSWWLGLAAYAGLALLFLPLMLDWVTAVRNGSNNGGALLYTIQNVPLVMIPVFAWLGATRARTP